MLSFLLVMYPFRELRPNRQSRWFPHGALSRTKLR